MRGKPAPVIEVPIPAPLKRSGGWDNVKTLYHCTNQKFARLIISNMEFKPGNSGMFGAGIYFAASPEKAKYKARTSKDGNPVTITAEVFLGFMLDVPSARNSLTKEEVYKYGCHSVHGVANSGDEYIVYKADSIQKVVGVTGL
jgi:hypothetical protein